MYVWQPQFAYEYEFSFQYCWLPARQMGPWAKGLVFQLFELEYLFEMPVICTQPVRTNAKHVSMNLNSCSLEIH